MFKKRARPTEGLRTAATSTEGDAAEECVAVPAAAVKLSGVVTCSTKSKAGDSVVMSFESSRTAVSAVGSLVDLAAENEEVEEDRAREAREAQARSEAASDPSIYRGKGAYHEYVQKREKIDKKACALGPIRAPTSIKTSSVFDYKPDVCKVSAAALSHAPLQPLYALTAAAGLQGDWLLHFWGLLQVRAHARGLQGRLADRAGLERRDEAKAPEGRGCDEENVRR